MKPSVMARIAALEKAKPGDLVLEVEHNGILTRMTAKEYVAAGHVWPDGRIVAGNSLDDVDLLLSTVWSCIT